ncbi:SapC family protein [Aliikangiella coralliicola]|uniref:SapC family protein n=1 Tax=Aliikangiella coralliicola TaxID=2592383 RepID=A0A545UHJ9_9GAMM|nr:SapC family protein [Aliikangiella coralliicola]TQV88928.1 SapC family protein [Aliikangiella coralliicola]
MTKFVPINKDTHKNIRVKQDLSFTHAKNSHVCPLNVHEYIVACHEYPILFAKDSDTGQFRSIVLLGLKPKQNLFYHEQGWRSRYVPESLRAYPFLLSPDENNPDQGILCMDEDSDLVGVDTGTALFNEDASQTKYTNDTGDFLAAYNSKLQITQNVIQCLLDNSLLVARTLELELPQEGGYNLSGLYVIDEEKLNELSDEKFLDLKNKGYLPLIYAVLLSMSRIDKLINLSSQSN